MLRNTSGKLGSSGMRRHAGAIGADAGGGAEASVITLELTGSHFGPRLSLSAAAKAAKDGVAKTPAYPLKPDSLTLQTLKPKAFNLRLAGAQYHSGGAILYFPHESRVKGMRRPGIKRVARRRKFSIS
jgi:hypothetical protein